MKTLKSLIAILIFLAGCVWVFWIGFEKSAAAVQDLMIPGCFDISPATNQGNRGPIIVNPVWESLNVSYYCNCSRCISKKFRDGKTASGKRVKWGYVAASKGIPFGTKVELKDPILGRKLFTVYDRGRLIRNRNQIDVFIPRSMGGHSKARKLGRQKRLGRFCLDK